jgi:hypothetical protein
MGDDRNVTWERVDRLDPERLIAGLDLDLRFEGYCSGGEVGAAYVSWPDGHQSVLTARPPTSPPLTVIEALREQGYPVPRLEYAADTALVWELLPGSPPRVMTQALLDAALALNQSQAGAAPPGTQPVPLYLLNDGPGFCLHGPLREHSERTRRLERWVTSVGSRYPDHLDGDDVVHCDFTPQNLLVSGDQITGVVDWDGPGRGDRRFDLVTFRFGLHALPPAPPVTDRLDRLLDEFPPSVLEPAWAHMSLRMADWVIRHYDDDHLTHWLNLIDQRVPG